MSLPTLTPSSTTSAIVLPKTASLNGSTAALSEVTDACPIGAYSGSAAFVTGAVAQVAFVYKRLGGDVLDVEITSGSVFAAYEESCLEYSYIINMHQTKNVIGSALGSTTGSFNHRGEITDGPQDYALKYPKFSFEAAFRIGDTFATEVGVGGTQTVYSASISIVADKQDYNLQNIVSSSAFNSDNSGFPYYNKMENNPRIKIRQMYYVSPQQMWRFYGYYGGLNVVGNMQTYGQYADDSTFQVIPVWQNKLQAMSYEDHLYTRTSHYSYEIIDNRLRLFPIPSSVSPSKIWFKFTIEDGDIWTDDSNMGLDGVNNMNTIPFENLPYEKINSIGKQWIRRYALAICKEILGQVRGKFGGNIPIPGDNITLNASDLLSQAKEEKQALKEELQKQLDETTYSKLIETDAAMTEKAKDIISDAPLKIFVG
tara:strand:+ start:2604 stop:3884 length:1281 start_codon:yes stop_codon:yes gene_type:complete